MERNLRAPLAGIRHTGDRLGTPVPDVAVGVRSGDTSAADRRRLSTAPPDIMITTPESLFLMLTSQARESLRGVETVIVDEVHAVAGTKRGAHLARVAGAARRAAREAGPADRPVAPPCGRSRRSPGSSAARAPVEIVAPPSEKRWDLKVVVPVEDMTELGQPLEDDLEGPASGGPRRSSIWPHVEERVADLIDAAPLDHRVRQLPPPRRAAHRPAQRDRRRARRGARAVAADPGRREPRRRPARPVMAQSGRQRGRRSR